MVTTVEKKDGVNEASKVFDGDARGDALFAALSDEQLDEMDEILSEFLSRIDEPLMRGSIADFFGMDIKEMTPSTIKKRLYQSSYNELQGLSGVMHLKERALPQMKTNIGRFLRTKSFRFDHDLSVVFATEFLEKYFDKSYIISHSLFEQLVATPDIYHAFIESYNDGLKELMKKKKAKERYTLSKCGLIDFVWTELFVHDCYVVE